MKTKSPCEKCSIEAYCARDDWSLWDRENKKCPNYKEGMKQWKKFLKEEGYIK